MGRGAAGSIARGCLSLVAPILLAACGATGATAEPTWPVPPEVLPIASGQIPTGYGLATWALDPTYPTPDAATSTLHILVWERACSSGQPTTGRMSPAFITYGASSVTIAIGVRPRPGAQTCPGPPGTPAIVDLTGPLGARTLLDGGVYPPAPPSPAFPISRTTAPPAAFAWAIYNRTFDTMAVGPATGLGPCASARYGPGTGNAGAATVEPGALLVAVLIKVPPGYAGVVSVVVGSDGTQVTVGEIEAGSLPPCRGDPKN